MPRSPRTSSRDRILRWLVLAGVVLVGLLVVRAASLGQDLVTDGPSSRAPWTPPARSGPPLLPTPTPSAPDPVIGETPPEAPGLLVEVGLRVVDAALIICVVVLIVGVARMWRRTLPTGPSPRPWESLHGVPTPLQVRQALASALDADVILVGPGSPRNAIVQCWVTLERLGTEVGIPRAGAETTTEYVVRFLEVADADRDAVDELAALFQEARFSEHPVTTEALARARSALRAIRVSLQPPGRRTAMRTTVRRGQQGHA